ncbi:MAG: DUF1207 domain-containing protein, partial [Planctomycetes bacterium]|nr:DUF1207 domain-containing protein [Planctomycetota bacterium]
LIGASSAPASPGDSQWLTWTGGDRAFKPLLADPREASARVQLLYERHGATFFDAQIGGDIVMAQRSFSSGGRLTVSGRGLFNIRLKMGEESTPMQNSDYFGGVATALRRRDDEFELYLFHQSAHLGDEPLEAGRRSRINYSREAVRFLWARQQGPVRFYGGPTVNVNSEIREIRYRTTVQAGAEYRFRLRQRSMYVATDIQVHEENDWAANFVAQIGIELVDPETRPSRRPRIFVEFFNGFSSMGQFFRNRETYIMLGLGYNF